ncbi:molybdopterin-guanine dinucleotide biosynthesis protein MobB [Morganella morganii]|uniref:molybdopterin-guanine dinucleotide biosynthesis protein MobB n=1 Tax=Morganella morganii TaxID=582 RepID=UPI001F09F4DE|nr:molybdopterin-guanine dinucleotide biosynthesis protein MobB [Morganella morganii]
MPHPAPLLAVTAYSGTGKTTLLKKLIPQLRESGLRIGLVKHTHHDMDVDTPGKDSYELRKAGAYQTLVVSQERFALMTETLGGAEPDLMQLAGCFDTRELDLILVEGFKGESVPKIALFRDVTDRPYQTLLDEFVIAFASDKPRLDVTVPQLDINNITAIRDFIVSWLEHHP